MIKYKKTLLSLVVSSLVGLTACGGDSGGRDYNATGGSTASFTGVVSFAVDVDAPTPLVTASRDVPSLFSKAYAESQDNTSALSDANFGVVVVGPDGTILEKIPASDLDVVWDDDLGAWEVSIPQDPNNLDGFRLDCLVVVDISGPLTLTVGSSISSTAPNALQTPTTDSNVVASIASTVAFNGFLNNLDATADESWADFNIDIDDAGDVEAIKQIVENIEDALADSTLSGATSVAGYLAAIDTDSGAAIDAIAGAGVAAAGSTSTVGPLAGALADGGIAWFWGDSFGGELEYGTIKADGSEDMFAYNVTADAFEPLIESGELMLTDSGWAVVVDSVTSTTANSDGSITIELGSGAEVLTLRGVEIDVLDKPINYYFIGDATSGWSNSLDTTVSFAAGSKVYQTSITTDIDNYSLDSDCIDQNTCGLQVFNLDQKFIIDKAAGFTTGDWWGQPDSLNNFVLLESEIVVKDANVDEIKGIVLAENSVENTQLAVSLIGDTANATFGLVAYFQLIPLATDPATGDSKPDAEYIGQSTFERKTVNGEDIMIIHFNDTVTSTAATMGFDVSAFEDGESIVVSAYDVGDAANTRLLSGSFVGAGSEVEREYLYNDKARDSILPVGDETLNIQ